jgi:S-adenosylmethionine decarboxylase proenzyme
VAISGDVGPATPSSRFAAHEAAPAYAFTGEHLLLRYEECDADLNDLELMEAALHEAILASGATIRGSTSTRFEPQGLSVVFILAESHATIHTYPEARSAFLDIFTCGTSCKPAKFDEVLRSKLRPRSVHVQSITR